MMLSVLLVLSTVASSVASAGDLSVGWFDLGDPLVDGVLLGGAPSIGYRQPVSPLLGVEGRLSVSPDASSARATDLVQTLVFIAEQGSGGANFQQPLELDLARAEVLVDVAPPRDPGRIQVVPRARAGLGVELRKHVAATYDPATSEEGDGVALRDDGLGVAVPLIGELAFELWGSQRTGLRVCAGAMADLRDKPQYNPDIPADGRTVVVRSRIGLDFLIALGGQP